MVDRGMEMSGVLRRADFRVSEVDSTMACLKCCSGCDKELGWADSLRPDSELRPVKMGSSYEWESSQSAMNTIEACIFARRFSLLSENKVDESMKAVLCYCSLKTCSSATQGWLCAFWRAFGSMRQQEYDDDKISTYS